MSRIYRQPISADAIEPLGFTPATALALLFEPSRSDPERQPATLMAALGRAVTSAIFNRERV